jgi:replicative DNA helicase
MNLPTSVDVERAVLGYAMLSEPAMDELRELPEEVFSLEAHRVIWRRCCELYDAGTKVDRVTLYARLQDCGDNVGGVTTILALDEGLPDAPNLGAHVELLRDKAARRRLIYAAQILMEQASDPVTEISKAVESFTDSATLSGTERGSLISTRDLIAQCGISDLLSPRRHEGIKLPWAKLDSDLSGFRGGQVIVLMGETSKGKTSAALQIALSAASQGKTPIIWTMEMSPKMLFQRMVRQITGFGRSWQLTFQERESERGAIAMLDEHPIYFDSGSRTISSFCASLRKVKAREGNAIGVVDYLQLIRSGNRRSSRAQEVSDNSRGLKLAAMDFGIPILVLSQVDRSSVKGGGEIGLHSGKESGDIENDADVVMWIKGGELSRDSDSPITMWIGKQREGPAGFGIPMVFRPASQTFVEIAE